MPDLTPRDVVTVLGLARPTLDPWYDGSLLLRPSDTPGHVTLLTQEEAPADKWGPEVLGHTYWRTLVDGTPAECIAWLLAAVRQDDVVTSLDDI